MTTPTGTEPPVPAPGAPPAPDNATTFDADYVKKLRDEAAKYRTEAKTNADAAAELQRLKDSQKSEADKAADKAAQAETRLADLESRVLRRDIALEHKLSSEDAAMLDAITDETAMRNLAKRLSDGAAEGERKKKPNVVSREGTTTPKPGDDPVRAFARDLFGRSDE